MRILSIRQLVILASLAAGPLAAQTTQVIIPGAGTIGVWYTQVQFFNESEAPVTMRVFREGFEQTATDCPAGACQGALDVSVPSLGIGSAVLDYSLADQQTDPWTYRVALRSGSAFPVVAALMFDMSGQGGSFEIPVIRADALAARNPSSLVFPDAIASGRQGRSNLVVTSVGGDATVTVDAFTTAGGLVQSYTYQILSDTTLTLYDVFANYFAHDGAPEVNVALRARKIAGSGALWGYLVTVDDRGHISVERGTND